MIYRKPNRDESVDQGDLIDGFPVLHIREASLSDPSTPALHTAVRRVIVLTQTCDLAQAKATSGNVAEVFPADELVQLGLLKAADVRGPLRAGRVWGFYFLPADAGLGLVEMIVDLRRLHTVPLQLLADWCRADKRSARIQTPYREHLAKHFADTFSRIGLPRPYETL